ncbi:MAG: hypothetical protein M1822_007603 [Bathelium mastoideum]|nr:MAG: hypothetical protein M1822_007603 [Bathelium mastoideum]
MTDYHKLTVATLKTILKDRSIPSTGLTRKQQIVDKLQEHDAQSQSTDDPHQTQVVEPPAQPTTGHTQSEDEQATKPLESQDQKEHTGSSEDIGASRELADESTILDKATSNAPTTPEQSEKETSTTPNQDTIKEPTEGKSQDPVSYAQSSLVAPTTEKPSSPALLSDADPSPPLDGENGVDEGRKRKRRSVTPSADPEAVANKKRKQEHDGGAVHLKEDEDAKVAEDTKVAALREEPLEDIVMTNTDGVLDKASSLEETTSMAPERREDATENQVMDAIDQAKKIAEEPSEQAEEGDAHHTAARNIAKEEPEPSEGGRVEERLDSTDEGAPQPPPSPDKPRRPSHSGKDNRYKDLFSSASSNAPPQEQSDIQHEDEAPDTTPALHPATGALYIRELKRPLRAEDLRSHLISLSTPPTADSKNDESVLELFYLDSIRSHCFVQFRGVKEASRVRSALHNRVWPAGRDRHPLWVDFIPEETLADWIRTEEDAAVEGGRFGGKRWEVIYQDGEGSDVQAIFREVGPGGSLAPRSAPLGPRGSATEVGRPLATPTTAAPEKQSKAFQSLDELFQSTTAKPKLYYLPVSQEVVDKRLNELDRLINRDVPSQSDRMEEYRRFTYEDGDLLVDAGPDIGPQRGGPGRGRGGGYRSSYRGGPRYEDGGHRSDRYRNDEPRQGGFGYDRRGFRGR